MSCTVIVDGQAVDFDAVVDLMDYQIREDLHSQGLETEQAFIDAYAAAHEARFGETFTAF
jgi:hypothetical protein